MKMTKSERFILETIMRHDGQWNWYKLARYCFERLDSPGDLTLEPLLRGGYIESHSVANEPLPRLHITEAGKAVLSTADG